MKCQKIKPLLTLFLDGQLAGKKAREVKAHLEACPLCAKELNLLKESWNLLGEWKPVIPSPNFKAAFWQKVSQEELATVVERKPVFIFPKLKPRLAPAFATVTTILIIGILLVNLTSTRNLNQLALASKDEDISMLKQLDLMEELDIIKELHILEDLEIVDSIEL